MLKANHIPNNAGKATNIATLRGASNLLVLQLPTLCQTSQENQTRIAHNLPWLKPPHKLTVFHCYFWRKTISWMVYLIIVYTAQAICAGNNPRMTPTFPIISIKPAIGPTSKPGVIQWKIILRNIKNNNHQIKLNKWNNMRRKKKNLWEHQEREQNRKQTLHKRSLANNFAYSYPHPSQNTMKTRHTRKDKQTNGIKNKHERINMRVLQEGNNWLENQIEHEDLKSNQKRK